MKTKTVVTIGACSTFAAINLCDIFGADEIEFKAPLQTKSGRHAIVSCTDPAENRIHVFNTAETVAVWRPLGRNTWEFTDLLTQQKNEILEAKLDDMTCIKVTPAMLGLRR